MTVSCHKPHHFAEGFAWQPRLHRDRWVTDSDNETQVGLGNLRFISYDCSLGIFSWFSLCRQRSHVIRPSGKLNFKFAVQVAAKPVSGPPAARAGQVSWVLLFITFKHCLKVIKKHKSSGGSPHWQAVARDSESESRRVSD